MAQITPAPVGTASNAKKGALTGGALTDEVLESSRTVLRGNRSKDGVVGLQQYFSPPELAELIADVNGRSLSTLDPTAGNGSLLSTLDRPARFGIEIDADHIDEDNYTAIQGDVQSAYPLLRVLGTRFPRVACNPPFGLDWQIGGQREDSTLAAWRMATALLDDRGAGVFVAGRDRFTREVMPRADAAGIYALLECDDLFDGVELPCVVAFFVPAGALETPREGGPGRSAIGVPR